ncbi:hypothetical protein HQ36_07340 [Porphyromonas gingivicanis]|uniref:Uncharacterized protein n=1 Tax=Porphyromonas gingivicanis TaxID=266762 RepID=A0A0A2G290_9PORP|nr:tetratricopeptide repeat protein [Porphyromonas gingivicanis]KGN97363.1 hypothetical protein HQ36_07340 [Porphyromonas gingivicanis]
MNILKSIFGRKKETLSQEEAKVSQAKGEEKIIDRQEEKEADVLKFDGLRAMRLGEVSFALKALSKALELRPEFETRFYYAEALTLNHQEREALKQYDLLLEECPNHILCLINRASLRIDVEAYTEALMDVELALNTNEDEEQRALLYQMKAKVYLLLKEYDKVLVTAEQAIMLKAKSSLAYLQKIQALVGLERWEEANRFIEKAISTFPEEEQFNLFQAKVALKQEQYAEAYQAYQDALVKDPFNEEAYCGMACLLVQRGEMTEAIDFLEQTLKEQNPSVMMLSLLASIYKKMGLVEKEQKIREQIKEFSSDGEQPIDFVQQLYKGNAYGDIFGNLFS